MYARLHDSLIEALDNKDIRDDVRVDSDDNYQWVEIRLPVKFSFEGQEVNKLTAVLCSCDAYNWLNAYNISDEAAADFSVHFENAEFQKKKSCKFLLTFNAKHIVPTGLGLVGAIGRPSQLDVSENLPDVECKNSNSNTENNYKKEIG